MRDIPHCQDGIAKYQQQPNTQTYGTSSPDLVSDEACARHEHKVDGTDRRGDVVDVDGGIPFGFEVQLKVLHDVAPGCERPEAVGEREGVDLPGTKDARQNGPGHAADRLATFLLDALHGAGAFPVIEVKGAGRFGCIWETNLWTYMSAKVQNKMGVGEMDLQIRKWPPG